MKKLIILLCLLLIPTLAFGWTVYKSDQTFTGDVDMTGDLTVTGDIACSAIDCTNGLLLNEATAEGSGDLVIDDDAGNVAFHVDTSEGKVAIGRTVIGGAGILLEVAATRETAGRFANIISAGVGIGSSSVIDATLSSSGITTGGGNNYMILRGTHNLGDSAVALGELFGVSLIFDHLNATQPVTIASIVGTDMLLKKSNANTQNHAITAFTGMKVYEDTDPGTGQLSIGTLKGFSMTTFAEDADLTVATSYGIHIGDLTGTANNYGVVLDDGADGIYFEGVGGSKITGDATSIDVVGEVSLSGVTGSGKAVCVKADGDLGVCSDAVVAGGTCTCA